MNSQYRNNRYRLHKFFLTYSTKEEAMEHILEVFCRMIGYGFAITSQAHNFRKLVRGTKKKKKKAENDIHTTVGTKSLASVVEEKDKIKELHASTLVTTKEICEKEVGYVPGQPHPSKSQAANFQLFRVEIEKHMKRADAAAAQTTALVEQSMLNKRLLRIWNNKKEKQKSCTSSLLRK
ncbi:hypothetical protein ACH5RR_031885 [Cinchona calisaya]|uniref:WH1 domain-containing protein n=1 Tax=Cinchona calisaya TaxID=153742 RepID=A0ABD2YGI3_9GENT